MYGVMCNTTPTAKQWDLENAAKYKGAFKGNLLQGSGDLWTPFLHNTDQKHAAEATLKWFS